jgi:16S rRNA (cytidine1402-2'-O)-methyltransferase
MTDTGGHGRSATPRSGALTLVGTPIGNLGDLTAGALLALRAADIVCAEDTRRTRKLLTAYDIHPPVLVSLRAHNEAKQSARVVRWVAEGKLVAYVTDAGMPTVSDPGQLLARQVIDAGCDLAVEPGPDAVTSALLIAGVANRRWCFEGFLPAKGSDRTARLRALSSETRTCVVYEAPHRLLRTLADFAETLGPDREAVVVKDLTKRFERVWRGRLDQVLEQVSNSGPRGEFVIVLVAP